MPSQRQVMITEKIKECMRAKFQSYDPETRYMPFHYRLLGKDRMAFEVHEIREVCLAGILSEVKLTQVDIWLENYDGELFLIDLKTVKLNRGNFKEFKRTLLEWAAAELTRNLEVIVNTMIGIPYNPYEPKPYERWTMKGTLDLGYEVLVAEELWDFLGGAGSYTDLLDAFEIAGIELRPEIDSYFEKFRYES